MKRELVFRAWYEGNPARWYYFVIGQSFGSYGDEVYKSLCLNGATFYQNTGLKDKNGKEIFEGDILGKRDHDYDSDEYLAWQQGGYEGHEPDKKITKRDVCTLDKFRLWLKNESFGYEGEELEDSEDWEVLGNIHENPELL